MQLGDLPASGAASDQYRVLGGMPILKPHRAYFEIGLELGGAFLYGGVAGKTAALGERQGVKRQGSGLEGKVLEHAFQA